MTSKIFNKKNYFSISKDAIFTFIQDKAFMLAKNKNNKYYFYELNIPAYLILKEMQKEVDFEQILKRCKENFKSLSEKDIKETRYFILKLNKAGIIKSRIKK